jgi:hypothetical protein
MLPQPGVLPRNPNPNIYYIAAAHGTGMRLDHPWLTGAILALGLATALLLIWRMVRRKS